MVNLVPELELLIGEQPPVPDLPPQQAQSRLQMVFRRFPRRLRAARNIRWRSFSMICNGSTQRRSTCSPHLFTQSDVRHLLLIGAYRDNESQSRLIRCCASSMLSARRERSCRRLVLRRSPEKTWGGSLRIRLAARRADAAPLARLVHEKTGGNPFFAIQFISALAEEGLLRFDHDAAGWRWELDRIHAKGYTDNVVDLMVGKLTRLPVETQAALQQLACLGNVAEITMLSIVLGKSNEDVRSDLWDAVRLELVEHLEGSYKFIHDRVQEAAYSLIPERLRAEAHLRIGRLLAAHTPAEKREEAIFEIVNQLNRGAALITSPDEREQLAEFNLLAGQRAKATTAYASALTYLAAGAALLPEDSWERRHELTFALELHRAECEFLTGALAEAEQRLAALSARAANTLERATVACLRVDLYTTLDQSSRAIAVGLDYLRHLGYRLVAASDGRGSATRIRADLVAAREPHDRVSDRAAFDERPGIPRDDGRSDQDRATCILYGREPACPGHLPSGQSQPRARQLRRFVHRLCVAGMHRRRRASATIRPRISLRSARL